jgi:hypothetical protein
MLTRYRAIFRRFLIRDTFYPYRYLITEYMELTDESSPIELCDIVRLRCEYMRRNSQTTYTEESPIDRIDHLDEVLMSTTRLIHRYIEHCTMRIIGPSPYLTSRDIMSGDPASPHRDLSDLTQIREPRTCEDLMRWDITIHTVESDILRDHTLELGHEWDEYIILIWDEFASFPDLREL